jgi:hypothetical protein
MDEARDTNGRDGEGQINRMFKRWIGLRVLMEYQA